MARLPVPGNDSGNWGIILNDYLSGAHNSDGTLRNDSVGAAQLQDDSVTAAAIAPGSVTKSDVGLSDVDNTADVNKPISTATQTALNAKLGISNNLSDLASAATARTNLGLGSAATMTPATLATDSAFTSKYIDKIFAIVDAADPQFGTTRDHVQINNAINYVASLGGGMVRVRRKDGPWTISRRISGDHSSGGIFIGAPNITLEFDDTVLNLAANCDFIKIRSDVGTKVTITADTVATDTTITVADSSSFTVGGWVFLRLGQASYDAFEPDQWLWAKVAAIPDATHLTLDRSVNTAITVASITSPDQKSVAPIANFVQNVEIRGTVHCVNSLGVANAEAAIYVQNARGVKIGNIVATNPGAGGLVCQFADDVTVGSIRVLSSVAQNGQSSKGRCLSVAESRGVNIGLIDGQSFENIGIFCEARTEGFYIDRVIFRNDLATRSNSSKGLILCGGHARVNIGSFHLLGNGSYLFDSGSGLGECAIHDAYFYTASRPIISNLGMITGRLFVDGILYSTHRQATIQIPLRPNMSAVSFDMPAGYWRSMRVFVTNAVSSYYIGSTGFTHGTNFASTLVAGSTVRIGNAGGFGSGYLASNNTGKRVAFTTDSALPNGAYAVIDVEYFADGTEADAKIEAPYAAARQAIIKNVNTIASSGTAQTLPVAGIATLHVITLTGNCTLTFPPAMAGASFQVVLTQDGTGGRTVTWPAVTWIGTGGAAPTLATAAGAQNVLSFTSPDGTSWLGFWEGASV